MGRKDIAATITSPATVPVGLLITIVDAVPPTVEVADLKAIVEAALAVGTDTGNTTEASINTGIYRRSNFFDLNNRFILDNKYLAMCLFIFYSN